MLTRLRRALSFSNVVSVIALTMAMGTGTAYAANTIFSADIVDGEVATVDLANAAVKNGKLAANAVNSPKVLDESLTAADLATGSVASSEIADDSIGASDLAIDSVGALEVADNTIDSGEIVDNTLSADDLAAGSVGAAEVANNSLTLADIVGIGNNGAISLSAGSIATGRCKDFTISASGAVVGETVLITPRATLAEGVLLYGVRVPAANQVTMKVCNLTGGTFPALVNLPIRTVTIG